MEKSAKSIARPAASRSLREAIRKARLEEAERIDRFADHRDGEIARLELLNHDAVLFRDGLAYFDDTAELIITPDQGARVAAALGQRRAIVLRGHGVVITGESVPWATYAALTLERVLRIQSIAAIRVVWRTTPDALSAAAVATLVTVASCCIAPTRDVSTSSGPHP